MRVTLMAIAGTAAAIAVFAISRISGGFLGAASFLLAIFIAAVTVGLAIAAVVNAWSGPPGWLLPSAVSQIRTTRRRLPIEADVLCGSCQQPMTQIDFIWVCTACDLVPVDP